MILVSVIIPVYKVENFLARSVESVLTQSYTQLEIILVDDGSPDSCPALCDAYKEKDPRVAVVHKENGGLSSARNAGLEVAHGKYVFFLDSDDWIEPNTINAQLDIAEREKVDFVRSRAVYANWPNHKDGEVCCFGTEVDYEEGVYDRKRIEKEILPRVITTERLTMGPIVSAWGGLYRMELLTKHGIRFNEEIKISEDLIFNSRVVAKANSFYYIESENYYHYFYNKNSLTKVFHKDLWENNKTVMSCFERYFASCDEFDFSRQLQLNKIFYTLDAIGECKKIVDKRKRCQEMKIICNDPITQRAFKRVGKLNISWKLSIILFLIRSKATWLLARI